MAVAAAVSNVIHCANLATTPQLSNKNDYPTTFRTQSSAPHEFGSGMTQLLQTYAPSYNVSIQLVTVYDISKNNMQEPLKTFADAGIQNIVIIAQYQILNIMRAVQQLGMLDGYLEGNTYLFGLSRLPRSPTKTRWAPLPFPVLPDASARRTRSADEPLAVWAVADKRFDQYTKTNQITVEGINNRMLMSLTKGNITQLVNNANLRDQWGNGIDVDANGDQVMEQDVHVYKYVNISSKKRIVTGVIVGKWSPANDSVKFNSKPFLFLGGKTAPPQPPTIPTLHCSAKKGMRLAFVAITVACSAFTLALLGYMIAYIKMKIFVASSPLFLAL
ncbi:hypothetical protein HDU96_000004 [Phlyctochytrium bullatum]|nr:hypothetical protein HDU96_000004 [Phlyctochytrium bullatum]